MTSATTATYSTDVARALDLVTWNQSWGDADVLEALSRAPQTSPLSPPTEASPLSPAGTLSARAKLTDELSHLREEWMVIVSSQGAVPDTYGTCSRTSQLLLDALLGTADGLDSVDVSFFETCVGVALEPLLASTSELASRSPLALHSSTAASVRDTTPPAGGRARTLLACYGATLSSILPHLVVAASTTASPDAAPPLLAQTEDDEDDGASAWYACRASQLYASHKVAALGQLLDPFIALFVEPLEKALGFHFAPGKKTARLDSPQHFFAYLTTQLTALSQQVRSAWLSPADDAPRPDVGLLLAVAQACFLNSARSVFVPCYQWHRESPFLQQPDYCTTVINVLIDFAATANALTDVPIMAECFVSPLLLPVALETHFQMASRCAARALEQGAAVLWRRRFLQTAQGSHNGDAVAFLGAMGDRMRCGTLHFIRCVDAYVSRMARDLAPFSTSRGQLAVRLWQCVVAPNVLIFARLARVHAEGSTDDAHSTSEASAATLARVERLCVVIGCCDATLRAADQWSSVLLQPTSDSAPFDMGVVDALTLFREDLMRECIALVRDLSTEVMAKTSAEEEGQPRLVALHRMDATLAVVELAVDERTLCVIVSTLKEACHRTSSAAMRAELAANLEHSGFSRVASVLA